MKKRQSLITKPYRFVFLGADFHATDSNKGKCAQEWALKTGRYETLHRFRRLTLRPKAEQFCPSFIPEWPDLKEKVAKAMAEKSATQKLTQSFKNTFGFRFPRDPEDNGVMDHMVRITTSIHSPLVTTGCRPLCPTSPPEIGKKRHAVSDLVKKYPEKDLEIATFCFGPHDLGNRDNLLSMFTKGMYNIYLTVVCNHK
uniref:Uncharacterized protein n=1 Tax=Periophthalmus magnuspinnatus TaxID=409849 RepID=A0A3B3ZYM2_9GOBI